MLARIINFFKNGFLLIGYYIGMMISKFGKLVTGRRGEKSAKSKDIESPRSILITGASSGIGAELARQYAGLGVFLYLTGRDSMRLNKVAAECVSRGAKVETVSMDNCDDKKVEDWIKALPRIDLAIANAGISGGTSEGVDNDEVREIFAVNIGGVLNTVLPLIDKARKQQLAYGSRGHIAIMASMASLRGLPSAPAYSASKACVATYAEALRGSLRHEKIQISSICPGYIRTPLTDENNFKMPLLIEVDDAAYIIRRGLAKRKARIYFPCRIYFLLRFVNMLPHFLTDPVFRMLPKKGEK